MTKDETLRTERLLMRRWRAEDREPFAAMNADPRVMEPPLARPAHLRAHVLYRMSADDWRAHAA